MWFSGTAFWLLMIPALLMVGAFWFAARREDQERRRRAEHEYLTALRRIYGNGR